MFFILRNRCKIGVERNSQILNHVRLYSRGRESTFENVMAPVKAI